MAPELLNHPLTRADGSATYTDSLFTILGAVNGPVDVSRRDEIPDAAAIEVNVRPSSGTGGPRERWLESVIASLLKTVLLVHMHPRTLVQVTLQITKEYGADGSAGRMRPGLKDVGMVPALANAAFAALVDSGLPLERTMVAGLAVIGGDGMAVPEPSRKQIAGCRSIHAMVFSQHGDLLLNESAGKFSLEEWRTAELALRQTAGSALALGVEDANMVDGHDEVVPWLRKTLEEHAIGAEA